MKTQTFISIGRIPGQCVLIHKEDMKYFLLGVKKQTLDCVVIDLITGSLSEPITVQQLIDVCPFNKVTEMGEISLLSDLIVESLPEWKVKDIDKAFTCLRRPFNRLEVKIGPQPLELEQ